MISISEFIDRYRTASPVVDPSKWAAVPPEGSPGSLRVWSRGSLTDNDLEGACLAKANGSFADAFLFASKISGRSPNNLEIAMGAYLRLRFPHARTTHEAEKMLIQEVEDEPILAELV